MSSRTYQGRDGQTRFSNDIYLTDVQFLNRPQAMGSGDDGGYGYVGEAADSGEFNSGMDDADDLPF